MTSQPSDELDDLDGGRSCVIITGAPGAGKSTVSRLLAESLGRSAVLNGDHVNRLILSGHVWALGEPADEAARQVRLCNENLCALAANIADAGFTPVIDWIIRDRAQLDHFLEALRPRRILLVVLAPGPDVCRDRDARRPAEEQFAFDGAEALTASMRTGFGDLGWWLDTSDLRPDETAAAIVASASTLALIRF